MLNWLRKARVLDPGIWGAPTGKTRVLIENPEPSELWGYADALRSAGYEVATCGGPGEHEGACPLLAEGHCALVEGADVVVSTSELPEIRSILAALGSNGSPRLVLETPPPAAGEYHEVARDAVLVACPVTEEILCRAVAEAGSQARP